MLPIPAIDIRDGRCVRLLRGDFAHETIYGDPVVQALAYVEAGAPMLHVVDLDAARTGRAANDEIVSAIIEKVTVPVEFGGGVRDIDRARELLERGVARVVIGTLAVEDVDASKALAETFPERVVVGLDFRFDKTRRLVAIRGWEESGEVELDDALRALEGAPFAGAVITDISRDGTLAGPDLEGYRHLLDLTGLPVIASGGVGMIDDLVALRELKVNGRHLEGVIIGRALLDGSFSVAEAVAACAP